LNYLLFALYAVLLGWCLPKIPFIKRSGLSSRLILGLFMLKVIAGIAIGWISLHIYGSGNDYWDINRDAWQEYQLLFSNPHEYFTNLFSAAPYPTGFTGVFASSHSFWIDLTNNVIIKIVSVFNIFSRGDYYINSLFYNFIIFFGHIALYRIFIKIYEGRQKMVIIGCFLLPSMLYFSSGIHKDGIVFLMLAILCYNVFEALQNKFSWKRVVAIVCCLFILFVVRNFVMIALLPALAAWLLASRIKRPAWQVFTAVYILSALVFFNVHSLSARIDPLSTIVARQYNFMELSGAATPIPLNKLEPTFTSFAKNAPQAYDHLLLRPYLWEMPSPSVLPLAIELFIYQLLFILFLFFRQKKPASTAVPFIYFGIFFTLSAFLFIGYIVPNLGSLVRYRSLYLPFIMTPILCSIDWGKVRKIVRR
jgi:hypothetical protein